MMMGLTAGLSRASAAGSFLLLAVSAIAMASVWLASGSLALAQQAGDGEHSSRPWMLGIVAQMDDLDSDSFHGSFNWAVTENTWGYLSAGRNRFSDGANKLTTDSLLVGFDHAFPRLGVGFDAEVWGDSEAVESTDLRGTIHFGGERVRAYLELETRDVHLSPLLADRVDLDVTGKGIGGRLRVNLTDTWRLYLRGMNYDYQWSGPALASAGSLIDLCRNAASLTDRCEELQRFVRLLERRNLFIQSTLANNSFLDSERALSMEWEVGEKLINLHLNRDRAADQGRTGLDSVGGSVLFPISERMDLELSLGRSESEVLGGSTFGGFFLLLYGD